MATAAVDTTLATLPVQHDRMLARVLVPIALVLAGFIFVVADARYGIAGAPSLETMVAFYD